MKEKADVLESPVKLFAHLFDAQAFLMHVTQVKHGLGTVLLL